MRYWTLTGDFETRSRANLREVGAWRYSRDRSTRPLCFHFALDDGSVHRWRPGQAPPVKAFNALANGTFFEAHNAFFEWCIWHNVMVPRYGWPRLKLQRMRCSAAKAAVSCYPRALEKAGFLAGCEFLKADSSAMDKLSKPRKPTKNDPREWFDDPELFEQLYDYCDQDILAERDLSDRLSALIPRERRVFLADFLINLRGIRIDTEFVRAANLVNAMVNEEISQELAQITLGAVMAATEGARIQRWLSREGIILPKIDKEAVEDALYHEDLTDAQRSVLELRQEGSRSSIAKYEAYAKWVDGDEVRGLIQYYGANAHGRFSGKGPQPQNPPRGKAKCLNPNIKGAHAMECMVRAIKQTAEDRNLNRLRREFQVDKRRVHGDPESEIYRAPATPAEVLSTAIRGTMIAHDGRTFGIGDYSAIEARKVFWFSEEIQGLQMFKDGVDIYRHHGGKHIFNKPPEDLNDYFERMLSKTTVLGCGYGMSWMKFQLTCKRDYGIIIPDRLAKKCVYSYRDVFDAVPEYWKTLDKALKRCIRHGGYHDAGMVEFRRAGDDVRIRLPSGRDIVFRHARIRDGGVTFINGKGFPENMYGGKCLEYVSSGSARDVLADAMVIAEFDYDNVDPVMHSHDELICEGRPGEVGGIVQKIMLDAASNYKGLPMKVATAESPRYYKG